MMATALNSSNDLMSTSTTVVEPDNPMLGGVEDQVSSGVVRLKLNKTQQGKKVSWTNDTVDNEHLGKKKSKCCCIYVRPKAFDESSSDESDGECEHCAGHVERRNQGPSSQLEQKDQASES